MVDKDRYNMRKLPDGMTHDDILRNLEDAYQALKESDKITPELKTALRYVAAVIVDEKFFDFHSRIAQRNS